MIDKRSDFSLLFFCIPKLGTFIGILDCVKKTIKDWISSFSDYIEMYKDGISCQNGSACSSSYECSLSKITLSSKIINCIFKKSYYLCNAVRGAGHL